MKKQYLNEIENRIENLLESVFGKWVDKSYMSLFILQTVQKFGEAAENALTKWISINSKKYRP